MFIQQFTLVQDYHNSSLSLREYAAVNGISKSTLGFNFEVLNNSREASIAATKSKAALVSAGSKTDT
ncbi:hypothetical protein [Marinagarivorans algicola]|uniref:hypothetical protein n=1 Tax=Marinagarivorans algicola TaxID=1513270 RepID=UPI0006B8D467|nr:hypothetical protein [Marinagarivorans algicola]